MCVKLYTYSLAWKITHEDYTMQRPLVMDWRTDENVRDIGDQFMFGPAILVSPVTIAGAVTRSVYLPPAAAWYSFWTGKKLNGGQRILADAPLARIPLYVRAGATLPLGPASEYAGQDPVAPIELRIFPSGDGSFDLYDDQGDTYNSEKGEYAVTDSLERCRPDTSVRRAPRNLPGHEQREDISCDRRRFRKWIRG